MKSWPRAADRRRLDPKPLRVTVKGVTVYMREYQQHSSEAEAACRVQDGKEEDKEAEDRKAQNSEAEANTGKEDRQEALGEALMREIRESAEAVDNEIREYEAEEKCRRQESEREERKAAEEGRRRDNPEGRNKDDTHENQKGGCKRKGKGKGKESEGKKPQSTERKW